MPATSISEIEPGDVARIQLLAVELGVDQVRREVNRGVLEVRADLLEQVGNSAPNFASRSSGGRLIPSRVSSM